MIYNKNVLLKIDNKVQKRKGKTQFTKIKHKINTSKSIALCICQQIDTIELSNVRVLPVYIKLSKNIQN